MSKKIKSQQRPKDYFSKFDPPISWWKERKILDRKARIDLDYKYKNKFY